MAICQVSGTVYNGEEGLAANVRIRLTPVSITGVVIYSASFTITTNASGVIQDSDGHNYFEAIRGGTYKVEGPILGYNAAGGANITIPSAATANFADLISVASIPATGLTIKDEGVALASLIGTFDFVGAGVTVTQASPGVATVTITSGGGITTEEADGTPSFAATTLRVDQADGLVLTNPSGTIARLDLAGVPYSALTLTGGIVNADVNAAAAIAYSKLNLTGAILNADLAGSIALSKLAALTASRVLVSDGSGVISPSSITSTTLAFLDATSSIQTQLNTKASTTYVDTSIANLVDSSPAALDTLNELAAALGDDANFATTVTNALAGKQTSDATLTALAAYNTNGLLTQTAADTFTGRTLTGTANQISVANGDGVSGNPTLSLPADVLIPTVLTVPNTGLHLLDTNASHDLIIAPGSNLTADHTLTLTTGDADRILTINGDVTLPAGTLVPNSITLTAGDGLTGGGDLSANRTFTVGAGTGIAVAADAVSLDINGLTEEATIANGDFIAIYDVSASALRKMTKSNFTTGLGGGGDLTVGTTGILSGTNTRILFNNSGVLGEYTITGTGNVVMSASPTLTGTIAAAAATFSSTIVQTSNSATAFESGPNGSTNPVFRLVNNVSSQATGLSITGNAAAGGVALTVLSSGSNEPLTLIPKGTGLIQLGGTSGSFPAFQILSGGHLRLVNANFSAGTNFYAEGLFVPNDTTPTARMNSSGVTLANNGIYAFSSTGAATGAQDLLFGRAAAASAKLYGEDAATNAVTNTLILGHNSSNTPTTGFGGGIKIQLKSSTTTDQEAAQFKSAWGVPTHASRSAWAGIATNLIGSASFADRYIAGGSTPVVTDNTALSLFDVSLATLQGASGRIVYEVFCSDGTEVQSRRGIVMYSAVNKGGVYTTEVVILAEAASVSAGTLTATWTVTNGTNKVTLQITPDTSLTTPTSYYVKWNLENLSESVITVL